MGFNIESKTNRVIQRQSTPIQRAKSVRLGWKSIDEGTHVCYRDLIGRVKRTDTTVLSKPFTSCSKIL